MSDKSPERLRFGYGTSFMPGGSPLVMWDTPCNRDFNYVELDDWISFAQELERVCFDAFFLADHSGVHDTYKGTTDVAVRVGLQTPLCDPMVIPAALATSTSNLGFVISSNIIQAHPYAFARRISTLDHLTKGRIGWNIVMSYQKSAWENLGRPDLADHADRYREGDEYCDVTYKLWEGSWQEGAVVRERDTRTYTNPELVHKIDHSGEFYQVPGIHIVEPSPQRVPLLFQAGSSETGMDFAARNAEATFMLDNEPEILQGQIGQVLARAEAAGRHASDILPFVNQQLVIGSTEEEAKQKHAEFVEYMDDEMILAFTSSYMGTDLSQIDVDMPMGELAEAGVEGAFKFMIDAMPDKSWTFRQLARQPAMRCQVGTPEQIADHFAELQKAGVRGILYTPPRGWGDIYDFTNMLAPELQQRGLMQSEYEDGTFREKMFGNSDAASGPYVNERHPASAYRKSELNLQNRRETSHGIL